eukprot:GHVU01212073.1.p1 GENE.GHVU01212073.1~~GHVU01212073.1.p1  ORF type:complete len:212 (-),score=39.36 GHVU01212073.1:306-908(-)
MGKKKQQERPSGGAEPAGCCADPGCAAACAKTDAHAPAEAGAAPLGDSTGSWVLDAILQPGSSVSTGTLSFLDKVFVALFCCIFGLMWLTGGQEFHTYVFLFLAAGLFASVKFFVAELKRAQAAGTVSFGDVSFGHAPAPPEVDEETEEERVRLQEQLEMSMQMEQELAKLQLEQALEQEQMQEIRRRAAGSTSVAGVAD